MKLVHLLMPSCFDFIGKTGASEGASCRDSATFARYELYLEHKDVHN